MAALKLIAMHLYTPTSAFLRAWLQGAGYIIDTVLQFSSMSVDEMVHIYAQTYIYIHTNTCMHTPTPEIPHER